MGDKNVLKLSFATPNDKNFDIKTELYLLNKVNARVMSEDIVTYC
jgi:hypothetical protein